eukprot:CAMPEP_0167761902 /NCGR_PEP_ID=MMETSP0110_2-20121227/12441_1 /TAXON_ID=629695 /ORGANISM="Gymnochlora sp., Strain CCMP2014" /LENGTH=545 /DNA_ID=CAMNT_0007648659 /DNA_START=8 /DNA_END=1645 /DNA_ORIENTATION=-
MASEVPKGCPLVAPEMPRKRSPLKDDSLETGEIKLSRPRPANSPVRHGRSNTMPQRPNMSTLRRGSVDTVEEEYRSRTFDRQSFTNRRSAAFVGSSMPFLPEFKHKGGVRRNLLFDLDKIEKTAGLKKLKRRNSISIGELWEAKALDIENSHTGSIEVRSEWKRKRFLSLFQAMKRRKMIMRLRMRALVPREVRETHSQVVKEIKSSRGKMTMLNPTMPPKSRSSPMASPSSARSQSVPDGKATPKKHRKENKSHRSIGGNLTVTLDKQKKHERKSSKIFVLNQTEEVLLAATKLKIARKQLPSSAPYGGMGMVFLARHGEREDHVNPKWYLNAPNVFDPPLSKRGFEQAHELGVRLRNENITHIVASPFTRTIQTAIEVAKELGLKIHIDLGIAEHMETKQFKMTCRRLQLDSRTFKVKLNKHEELLKQFPNYISKDRNLPEIKLNKWPALYPEEEDQLFERTNNTVKHFGLFAFKHKANVLLVSHQTPVEYMAFELCSEAEDKFVSVCCLTKAAPRKNNPAKKGWKLLFQHDDSFLSEPECAH